MICAALVGPVVLASNGSRVFLKRICTAGIMMYVQPAPIMMIQQPAPVMMMQQPAPTMIIMGGGQP
jgi:hypothetical protein